MKKRVILSAGGTGGHLFPAQTLAADLTDCEVLFVAGGLSKSRYFEKERFCFKEISCATFSFSKPLQILKGCYSILKGVLQSRKIIRHFSPDLVVGFGSFFTLPVLIAAKLEKVPFILHEQNAIPGKVNRLFSSFAHTTAITFPVTRTYLKDKVQSKTVEVSFPLRNQALPTKEEMWSYFGLTPEKPTLLVFGGSQGAAKLNSLMLEAIHHLPNVQVLHFTGTEPWAREAEKKYQTLNIPACVKTFETSMDYAMQISDLAITRAGAATVSELIEYELPALLIPYPFATDNHQEKNGAHFVFSVKGGKMYKESDLESTFLAKKISDQLLCLKETKKNIVDYKQKRSAIKLATLIEDMCNGKT